MVLGSWNFIQLSSDCSNYKVLAAAWAHGCRALYITADEYVQVVLLKFPGQVAGINRVSMRAVFNEVRRAARRYFDGSELVDDLPDCG